MEEKRQIVRDYVAQGIKLDECLGLAKLSKSSYYYKRNYRVGGKSKTCHTLQMGVEVPDGQVVDTIKELLGEEFLDYGYRKVTTYLKRQGYNLGKKKVYRLMSENNLTQPLKTKTNQFDKDIVKSKPRATKPLQIIEIDIKYVYIDGLQRNAYLITMYDIFHREAYVWTLNLSMTSKKLIELILKFVDQELITKQIDPKHLEISFRTDNGSQFISKVYRALMKRFGFKNVYIPPATPQLNGHIESFHSTVQKLVCDKYELRDLEHANDVFERFFTTYNNMRYLTCLLDHAPKEFIKLWESGLIDQKQHKNKYIFFFKEKDEQQKQLSDNVASIPSPEVNLEKSQDFVCFQNKDIVNLP